MTAPSPAAPELAAAMAETRAVRESLAIEIARLEAEAVSSESLRDKSRSGMERMLYGDRADWSRAQAARLRVIAGPGTAPRGAQPDAGSLATAGGGNLQAALGRAERAEAALAGLREIAGAWARRAPAGRTVAEEFTTSPHDAVSSDCGREILAVLGEPERPAPAPEPAPDSPCYQPDCGGGSEWATVRPSAEGGEAS